MVYNKVMYNKRLNIFTGHFGSGKTEVALNYALKLSQLNNKTAIVDFDIVNPYFRTTDAKAVLEEKNIRVITPMYANTNVDVPALPPQINTLFEKKEYKAVFDVGGDDLGARVLSRYRDEILQDEYEMFFVINVKRPMTDTLEKIIDMVGSIEESSRIKVTKLVNNTNLLHFTSEQDIIKGHELIEEVSERLNIPIGFVSCFEGHCQTLIDKSDVKVLSMEKHLKLPWEW